MARMIPARYSADYSSDAERQLFRQFRDDTPDDWVVLHSLDIAPRAGSRHRGEADFVAIVPDHGLAVIEAKTFAKLKESGNWDYGTHDRDSRRSPFAQAEQAKYSIMRYVRDALGAKSPFICAGVVTPRCEIVPPNGRGRTLEWNEWQAIGPAALSTVGLAGAITRLIVREAEAECIPLRAFDVEAAAALLRPDFEVYLSPAARRSLLEADLKRFTAEQFDVLDEFEANGQLLVDGPAGTGKTVLALETVRRASCEGQRVLLLCYNRLLSDWLKAQVGKSSNVEVRSMHSWLNAVLRDASRMPPSGDEALAEAAAEALLERGPRYDLVVLDEAQDLIRDYFLEPLHCALEGGLPGGRWVFFGDMGKQDVFLRAAGGLIEVLDGYAEDRVFVKPLRKNCRNTRTVADFAVEVGQLPVSLRYSSILRPEEGRAPQVLCCSDADAPAVLANALDELLADGYSPCEIVVLTLGSVEESVPEQLRGSTDAGPWRDRLAPWSETDTAHVRYETVRRFKGLEAAVVVVTDVCESRLTGMTRRDLLDELLYIGSTRALDRLVLLADSGLCAQYHLAELARSSKNAATLHIGRA